MSIAMCKVTLACSLHRENGLCSSAELLKLLRAIDPDVIFGEVPQTDLSFYDPRSLEGQEVRNFIALKPCRQVPVDQYEIPPNFHAVTDLVFEFVEEKSREYQQLLEERHHAIYFNGFTYLNGADFAALLTRMSEVEEETIKRAGNPDLDCGLAKWRKIMQDREQAMIKNIYGYCRANAFDQGVFLVGAAHRIGTVQAIKQCCKVDADLIEWKLNF
jgi:hypothetical protein